MSRRQQIMRKRLTPGVLGAATVLVLTGCGAGLVSQTADQVAAVDGAQGDAGPIALRNAVLAYPGGEHVFGYAEGDDAPLLVTIVNSGDQADELVWVTTPVAAHVVVAGATTIPAGSAVSSVDDDDNEVGISAPATAPSQPLGRPSDGGELRIVLTDLLEPIRPGLTTPVTFRFATAGEVTLQVPIDTTETPPHTPPAGEGGHKGG